MVDLHSGTWQIRANGFSGELVLSENRGDVTGTMFGDEIEGLWDDVSQTIVLMRKNQNPSAIQVYTGYLFRSQGASPLDNEGDVHLTISGFFEAFRGTGATPQRVRYGWYAIIGLYNGPD